MLVGRERAPEQRQVLADELFLQVDGVGADDGALAVGARPGQRRHQVCERLADAGARLEQEDAAVVVAVRDVGGHVPLGGPVLVLPEHRRHRTPLAQGVHHVEGVDAHGGLRARDLDDHVQLGHLVVDDAEADAAVVKPRRDVEVGAGGLEPAARMVVQQHLAALGGAGEREHGIHRAPGDGPGAGDHAVAVHLRHERDLPAPRRGDLRGEVGPDARGDPLAHVLSSFFFAAGKRTLLRISR